MKKLCSLIIFLTLLSFSSQASITGATSVCVGGVAYVSDSVHTGGIWTSSDTNIANIYPGGSVDGIAAGSVILTYTYGSPATTEVWPFTVFAAPAPITGPASVCPGASISLSSATPGGTWTSSNPGNATVSASGVVYGVATGWTDIYYYAAGSPCSVQKTITIINGATGSIAGPGSVCAGSTAILVDSAGTSGTWTSSNNTLATVSSSGFNGTVYGVALGTVTITYTFNGICGVAAHTKTMNVVSSISAGTISGASTMYVGDMTTLTATASDGTWSSSNPGVAYAGSMGDVSGMSAGTATISYSVAGCTSMLYVTHNITVLNVDNISGDVIFSGSTFDAPVRVWLITYDASTGDLTAVDSIITRSYSSIATYSFLMKPTGVYRVKAAVDSVVTVPGYIPTYHNSSLYWHSATTINHTAGTSDMNKDIVMMAGIPTSGPGFIGGNVASGANKGTSTGDPVPGLRMNLLNAANELIQTVRTDALGNYSFSHLPIDVYYVFPDSLNYLTTPYTEINLTTTSPSMSVANFIQHTLSGTITPATTGINSASSISSVAVFPNPANDQLALQWTAKYADKGTVTISDITGRELYRTAINFSAGTGAKTIDLSSFTNGLYLISVRSASSSYTTKVQVQH